LVWFQNWKPEIRFGTGVYSALKMDAPEPLLTLSTRRSSVDKDILGKTAHKEKQNPTAYKPQLLAHNKVLLVIFCFQDGGGVAGIWGSR
jgi:hypothetical protein